MSKRARMNSPVKITKPKSGINKNYQGELGTIVDIKTEERHTYYMVRLNGGHQISVERDEITVL
jgi:hypothetical protein